ncbi:PREDICTED: sulfhydryl oxidase 2 [Lepidothrix coronata]|uniref:Sulfhydryl oxidase n=1 Tax=Lepidothrix coronata TaxID=321398 RepID=A0A6J0GTX4_9PASS|nr:PREDICTED: sulfhydryl oxidase 2 [Lepidothrix coronata]
MAGALLWRGPAPPLSARPNMAAAGGGRRALLPLPVPLPVPLPLLLPVLLAAAAAARLYRPGHDPLTVLTAGSVRPALLNSSTAWVVQFYSSSCGHCIAFAPTWRALAGDVKDWEPAIRLGVLDCGEEENYETCKEYGIHFYPTFRYFKAFTKQFTAGEAGADREPQTVRQKMIDFLQNHSQEVRPPACPPLDPVWSSDITSLFDKNSHHYTAIVFESNSSYLGREVILDLSQYENLVVRRALNSDKAFLEKLGVPSVPSCYLIHPNGSHGLINNLKPLRSFFSSYLKSLPGVRKKLLLPLQLPAQEDKEEGTEVKVWKEFDKTKLYMADLESGLHFLLRVELATHKTLEGAELRAFKDFVTISAKLFPGRQPVVKLLETLQEWLVSLPLDKIPYDAILDLVNNKMRISGISLTKKVQWVGCQGSRPELRGYSCSLWKLFHTLTVQAALRPKALINTGLEDNPQVVLQVMRRYIQHFFGCKACAQHFEEMAKESMDSVKTLDRAVLWLWEKHNVVNNRLAGDLTEDPKFPKVQWPTPDICPACHEEIKGLHSWNEEQVLQFLKSHYNSDNILYKYTESQTDSSDPEQGDTREGKDKNLMKNPGGNRENKLQDKENSVDSGSKGLEKPGGNPGAVQGSGRNSVASVNLREVRQAVSFLGIGFSNIDMSLCVILYVASSLFLMIMYFFFRMRSKRWKVKHYRPSV